MAPSPFVLTVREQRRQPGTQRLVHVAGPLPGLAISAAAVPEDADIEAEVAVEAMTDGRVTATGVVRAPWVGACRRCGEDVYGVLEADVQEVFEVDPADDADTYPLDGDRLDLEPLVRDAVLLALPLAPLCDVACAGPDPDEHPVAVEGAEDTEPAGDPRWAALRELHLEE